CWNNIMFEVDSENVYQGWSTSTETKHTLTAAGSEVGILNYREIFDWVIFNEAEDDRSLINNSYWYANPTASNLNSSSAGISFLYSTNNTSSKINDSSYFLAAFSVPILRDSYTFQLTGLPSFSSNIHPTGRWSWQFP